MRKAVNLLHYELAPGEKNCGEYDENFELEEIEDINDKVLKYMASGQAVQDARYSLFFGDEDTEEDEDESGEDCEYAPDYISWYNERLAQKIVKLRKQKEQVEAAKSRNKMESKATETAQQQENTRSTELYSKEKVNTDNSQGDGPM